MEQKKENKKKKISIKKWIIKHAPAICLSFAAFVLLVGVLLAVFQAKEELVQYTISNEKVYMYVQDSRREYNTTITLDHEDKVTMLSTNEGSIELYNEPLYFEGRKEAIFPNTMSVIFPIEGQLQKKITRYTIANGEGLQVILDNQSLKYALTDGFIYDGGNIYFFVNDGILKWGDKTIELSAMSFVTCDYPNDLSYYNYETGEAMLYEGVEDVVYMEFEDYKINLSHDYVEYGTDDSFLLQRNIEILPALKK